jgi:hypothetical protein
MQELDEEARGLMMIPRMVFKRKRRNSLYEEAQHTGSSHFAWPDRKFCRITGGLSAFYS